MSEDDNPKEEKSDKQRKQSVFQTVTTEEHIHKLAKEVKGEELLEDAIRADISASLFLLFALILFIPTIITVILTIFVSTDWSVWAGRLSIAIVGLCIFGKLEMLKCSDLINKIAILYNSKRMAEILGMMADLTKITSKANSKVVSVAKAFLEVIKKDTEEDKE